MNSFYKGFLLLWFGSLLVSCQQKQDEDFPPLYEEAVDPDEGAEFAKIVSSFRVMQESHVPLQRAFHSKVHGCAAGEFQILADRPDATKQGIFKDSKTYPTVLRFSNGARNENADKNPEVRGMGIKLFGVPGEKLLVTESDATTQDFVMNNVVSAVSSSPKEFFDFIVAGSQGKLAFFSFLATHWSIAGRIIKFASRKVDSLITERYWSGAAFKLGDKAMKYNVQSCGVAINGVPDREDPNFLGNGLRSYVAEHGMCWTFGVQIQVDSEKTPIEDAAVEWTESLSPTIPVARIVIPRQDLSDKAVMAACKDLTYTPWHAIEEHRPLGRLNRVRRPAYALAQKTLRHGEVPVEPTDFSAKLLDP